MARRIRSHDWASTVLGPVEAWSSELRFAAAFVLDTSFPTALVWGPNLVTIYNDAFRPILGNKPEALGRSFAEVWSEAWAEIGPIAERALAGHSTYIEEYPLLINRAGKAEQAFFTFSFSPVRAADGTVLGIIDTVIERTAAVRSRSKLRENEERFRAFVTASSDVVYRMSPDWSQMRQLDGRGFLADTESASEGWVDTYILPADRPTVFAAIERAIRGREMFQLEHRVRRVDGGVGWTLSRAVPMLTDDGRIVEWLGAASDISVRKRAEAALRESEERFAQFAASSSDGLWIRDAATSQMEYVSSAIQMIYGVAPETLLGDPERWAALIVPDDRDSALQHLEQARRGEAVVHEFRILRPSDGEQRWIRNTDFPLHDAQGHVQRVGGIAEDVTETKRLQERQGVLVAELQHRTRNLMAVVRSMADKTMARSTDISDFQARFSDRLAALSRVQGLLSRVDEWDRVTFDALIDSELAALDGEKDRITLRGPKGVALRSSTVQTFALALHELTTNALKYGALAQPQARLDIAWHLEHAQKDGRPWLHVDWRERGVRMPTMGVAPQGGGSGRELIERALPYQLGARTTYIMGEDGVHCTVSLPVSERQSLRERAGA